MSLSDLERQALQHMVNEKGYLWRALELYFADKSARYDAMCSAQMRQIPREFERAADYAVRADENGLVLAQLESFARDL